MICCILLSFQKNPNFAGRRLCILFISPANAASSAMGEMKRLVDKYPEGYDGFSENATLDAYEE